MKLIIFELAGKKEAKKCKSIDDIVKLGNSLINDPEYLTYSAIVSTEIDYLRNDPKFVNDLDDAKFDYVSPLNDILPGPFGLRINTYRGASLSITKLAGSDKILKVSMYAFNNDGLEKADYIGWFHTDNDNRGYFKETPSDVQLLIIDFACNLVRQLITGELELKTAEYIPIVKYGRYHIKPTGVVRHRKPCLVASHDRAGHFKVLRSPRYYPDGIVPENEDELRRIPVKPCHVKRDIERVVIV